MEHYVAPMILLVVLFVGFGLVHRNGKGGGCAGCTTCTDKSECRKENTEADAARPR